MKKAHKMKKRYSICDRRNTNAKNKENSTAKNATDTTAPSDGRGQREADSTLRMMLFLQARYALRYNSVTKCAEYRNRQTDEAFRPIAPRTRNRMAIEVKLSGIDASSRDVRDYIESDYIDCYNPIGDFLDRCNGTWDGRNHIAALAHTINTDTPQWEQWFGTWFLAMVNQWQTTNGTYGNSTAPLLIAGQGFGKSTFCRNLLPPELAWGYTDSIDIKEKRQTMQAMAQMLLINLDEFNQITPAVQQGFLKNIMQLPTVKTRRPYATHMEELPRTASFIATSNVTDILADPSGNRRFIGVELKTPIDTRHTPDYRQLYAQALQLLRNGRRWWFNETETQAIMQWNRRYETAEPSEQYFHMAFAPATDECEGQWLAAAEIFDTLKRRAGSSMRISSLIGLGRKLANMPGLKRRRTIAGTQYLVKPL